MATASYENSVAVWDFSKKSLIKRLEGHKSPVFCLDYSSNGKHIVSGDESGTVIIWCTKKL